MTSESKSIRNGHNFESHKFVHTYWNVHLEFAAFRRCYCCYRDLPLIVCASEPLAGAWCIHPSIVSLAKHKKDVQSWLAIVKPFCRDQRSHRQLKRTLIRSRCDRIEKLNRFSISNFLLEPSTTCVVLFIVSNL